MNKQRLNFANINFPFVKKVNILGKEHHFILNKQKHPKKRGLWLTIETDSNIDDAQILQALSPNPKFTDLVKETKNALGEYDKGKPRVLCEQSNGKTIYYVMPL